MNVSPVEIASGRWAEPGPGVGRRRRELPVSWLLLPAFLLLAVFLVLPLAAAIWASLSPNVLVRFSGHGLANYAYLFSKAYYVNAILRTVRLSAIATALALLLGYPAALALRGVAPGLAGAASLAITLPVLCGPVVVVLGFMILLDNSGPLVAGFAGLGIHLPRLLGSETGIVIAMVHFLLPFVVLSLASVLRAIPDSLIEAARGMGATPWARFRTVIWPLSLPGVLSAAIIGFSLGTSAYVAPHYLGGPGDLTLTTLVTQFITATYNGQMAAAAAMVLMLLLGASMFLLTLLVSRRVRG